jgi:hypothetical protein
MFTNFLKLFCRKRQSSGIGRPRQRRLGFSSINSQVEELEDRLVMNVTFAHELGSETYSDNGGLKLNSVPIYLIFWGDYWNAPTPGNPTAQNIQDAFTSILGGPYLKGLTQYGVDGNAYLAQSFYIDSANPASNGFSDSEIQNVVEDTQGNQGLPESDDTANDPIYVVVTAPGVHSRDHPDYSGFNQLDHDYDFPFDDDRLPLVWVSGVGSGNSLLDSYTSFFSHEVAEAITSIGGDGIVVSGGTQSLFDGSGQIGDGEAQFYKYRLNGDLVQSYWSGQDGAYLVPDGNSQTLQATGLINATLTINGDQQSNPNDTITIDTVSSGPSTDGLLVTLNNETFQFDPGQIGDVIINPGSGTNTVNVNGLPYGVNVTVNDASGSNNTITVNDSQVNFYPTHYITIETGSATDTVNVEALQSKDTVTVNNTGSGQAMVNISPTAGNWGNVQGLVTVNGNSTSTALDINDRNDQRSETYSLDNVTGLSRAQAGSINISGLSSLTLHASAGQNAINVSPVIHSLYWLTNLTIDGGGGSSLTLDDSVNPDATTYTITANSVTRSPVGRATATINYGNLTALTLLTGTAADTVNVESTSTATVVKGGGGADTFNVAPSSLNLDGISGTLTGTNPLLINNTTTAGASTSVHPVNTVPSALGLNQSNGTLAIGNTVATRSPIAAGASSTAHPVDMVSSAPLSLDKRIGTLTTGNGVPIDAPMPAGTLTLKSPAVTGTLNGTVTSLNPNGINDTLTFDGGSGGATLTLNDQANPSSPSRFNEPSTLYTISNDQVTRTVSYALTGGQSTSTITYAHLTNLTLNAGNNGPNTVNIESTSVETFVNGGNATTQVNVAPTTQNLDNIAGGLTVSGGAGALNVYDQANRHGASVYSVYYGVGRTAKGAAPVTINAFYQTKGITLYTGKSPSQVTVGSVQAPTTINAGAPDAITVTSYAVPVTNVLQGTVNESSQLTVNADGGTLTIDQRGLQNDNGDTFRDTFTVTDKAVTRSGNWFKVIQPIVDPEVPPNPVHTRPVAGTTLDVQTNDTLYYMNVSSLTIDGGPIASTFNVQSTPKGMPVTINGSAGKIFQRLKTVSTTNQFNVGANGSVKNIRSHVTLNGSNTTDALLIDESQSTTRDKVTVTPTTVGAGTKDQFFGSGGGLTYGGMASLTLNLSHAADDTVHLTPSAQTAFAINGDPTEFQAGHGAVLDLDLAGATNALDTPSGPGAGQWTFGNRSPVTFQYMAATHSH